MEITAQKIVTCQDCINLETKEATFGERNEYRDDTWTVNINLCDHQLSNGVNDILDITALRLCKYHFVKKGR